MPEKLLFVCMGNICRSPAAEGITLHLAEAAGMVGAIECDSAGTISHHAGSPPDRRMRSAAERRGITLVGKARQFNKADFERFDRILAMDRDNYDDILALDPEGRYRDKVRLICEYCTTHADRDVPDPYYGGNAGFEYVLDLLNDACANLLAELKRQPNVDRRR